MQSTAATPAEYIESLPEGRKEAIAKLRKVILKNIPKGFEETMSYGMLGYVVPHSVYPPGYHCNPSQPLPFLAIASQKNFIAIYHMGLYADATFLDWFKKEYAKWSPKKLDMGKSCLRFKKAEEIPFDLMGKLAGKMTAERWIALYEEKIRR